MRIVQLITRPQRRGAEIFAIQLANELLERGHELWVISIFEGTGDLGFSGDFIRLDLVKSWKLDWSGFKKLADELDKIAPDIVQANASDTLHYAVGAKWFGKSQYLLVYRNANTISSFIRGRAQLFYNRLLHRQVDAVVSVSRNSKNDYLKLFKPKSILAIPIGVVPSEIDLKRGREPEVELPSDFLIQVGGLVPEKDPLGMLEIYAEVSNYYPDLKLVFLGSGSLEGELKDKVRQLNLTDKVEFLSARKNIFPILSRASALVMPSKIEGLPGVILEAMYCKIPVIAYGVGGITEVLKTGETGWCIDSGNSDDFLEAINQVLTLDTFHKDRILANAHHLVNSSYRIEKIAHQFEEFYSQMISIHYELPHPK